MALARGSSIFSMSLRKWSIRSWNRRRPFAYDVADCAHGLNVLFLLHDSTLKWPLSDNELRCRRFRAKPNSYRLIGERRSRYCPLNQL